MTLADLDRELLHRCLNNDHRSWEDFVDRFLGLVLHVIDQTTRERGFRLGIDQREQLCENVFAALYHGDYRILRNFQGRSSLTTYLAVIVRRVVVRVLLNAVRQRNEAA